MSQLLFLGLLLGVGAGRLLEMRVSQRNRVRLAESGAQAVKERYFGAMVALHMGMLVGSYLEVILLDRPFIPMIGVPALTVFILCNLLRWWVIRTLGEHWNVKVMDSTGRGVVTTGAYRYIRHPNYTAVFFELFALPLVHSAMITAVIGSLLHLWVLAQRVRVEEEVLLADAGYRAGMAAKKRFIPGVF